MVPPKPHRVGLGLPSSAFLLPALPMLSPQVPPGRFSVSTACGHRAEAGQNWAWLAAGPRAELYHGAAASRNMAQGQRTARASSGEAEKEELPASTDCELRDGLTSLERGYDQGGRRKRELEVEDYHVTMYNKFLY